MSISLVLMVGFVLALAGTNVESPSNLSLVCGVLAAVAMAATTEAAREKKITAGKHCDAEGLPKFFTLSLGGETVKLEPGKSWIKVDVFKWITRGLIEAPQSFHVLADGTVDLNGEKIGLHDPDGAAKLEHEINKRHVPPVAHKPAGAAPSGRTAAAPGHTSGANKVQFKVKLDHLGHITIECRRGAERVETGLRGLPSLVQNGFMLKPKDIHVDPLQRAIEIDRVRFECSEAGAHQLEEALNTRYAAKLQDEGENAIEIKENPAASTGFDIRFVTVRAGARFEIKGHLSQENLDILQDPGKCDLLQPGIVLRLSPPYLLIRRRRHDGSEEKIPELPDTQYRRATALQLRRIFNHALIRRTAAGHELASEAEDRPAELREMRLVKNPQNKLLLWLECVTSRGGKPEGKAFTHHNLADLQHGGAFRADLDVNLSLDHRKLSILNKQTNQDEAVTVEPASPDSDLARASRMLTAALKPPTASASEPSAEAHGVSLQTTTGAMSMAQWKDAQDEPKSQSPPEMLGAGSPGETQASAVGSPASAKGNSAGPFESCTHQASEADTNRTIAREVGYADPPAPSSNVNDPSDVTAEAKRPEDKSLTNSATAQQPEASEGPSLDESILMLFRETDPLRVNTEVFRSLAERLGLAAQDVRLSLPRVFENRRFEILSFSHPDVSSVLELRAAEFSGFYLSHNTERKTLFVYACNGRHVEFGPEKCELQASVTSEPDEFKGSALLGMAQNRHGHFVFVVSTAYKEWAKPREKMYEEAQAHFSTVKDLAAAPMEFSLIWPEAGRTI